MTETNLNTLLSIASILVSVLSAVFGPLVGLIVVAFLLGAIAHAAIS
jgi:hypothetical protein